MGRKRTKLIRAREKLLGVLDGIKEKNKIEHYTDAGEFLADYFIAQKTRKKIIENLKREVVF